MRLPDDTGRADLDTCAHCGQAFEPGQVWVRGVVDSEGKRRVVHGQCAEAYERQATGLRQPRARLKPREPEAFT